MSKIFSKLGKEYLMQAIPFTEKEIFHLNYRVREVDNNISISFSKFYLFSQKNQHEYQCRNKT